MTGGSARACADYTEEKLVNIIATFPTEFLPRGELELPSWFIVTAVT